MKKLATLFLAVTVLFSYSLIFTACRSHDGDGGSTQTQANCSHSYTMTDRKADCTSGGYATYTCSLCSKTYREYESALGHTTDNGTCARCGKTFEAKVWETAYYVDEFKNPTNEAYIRNSEVFVGVFSNSATTNSKLYVRVLIDADDIAIKLWEYGSQEVNAYSTTYYNITILDDNGDKHYTTGTMYKNGERIRLKDWTLVSLLRQNKKLKVYIQENSSYGYNSTYLFEMESGNFDNEYSNFYNT